jgi:mannose-6-phosphate isomerase-like protein (cupin superfamily)
MSERSQAESKVRAIHRSRIPPPVGELNPFGEHDFGAEDVVPAGGVSFHWTTAIEGQMWPMERMERRTMFLVLAGSARFIGDFDRTVAAGDVVTVRKGARFGFDDVHVQGLSLLEIGMPGEEATERSLEDIQALVDARLAASEGGSFFTLLSDGSLGDPTGRERLAASLQLVFDAFCTVLSTRRESRFAESFRKHFVEAISRDDVLAPRRRAAQTETDPVLNATATWFCRQMLVLDDLGKTALVDLVLERAGTSFRALARKGVTSPGATRVPSKLEGHDPHTYGQLYVLVEDGWDMFDTMGARISAIVRRQDPT